MRIIHVLRRSREWAEGNRNGPYWFGMQPFVDMWNSTFDVSYAEFRGELAAIRESGDDLSGYDARVETWQPAFSEEASRPGGLLVGCDEDDWLDPRLADVLRGLGRVDTPVRWDFTLYQGSFMIGMTDPIPMAYQTCNYALPTPVADIKCVTDHVVATQALHGSTEVYLKMPMGVQNRTPASSSLLWNAKDPAGLKEFMRGWIGEVALKGRMPPGYCMPLVERCRALCRRALGRGAPILMA